MLEKLKEHAKDGGVILEEHHRKRFSPVLLGTIISSIYVRHCRFLGSGATLTQLLTLLNVEELQFCGIRLSAFV